MALIIRKQPFFNTPTKVAVCGREVSIKADQIIVWVSLTEGGSPKLVSGTPRFPAILDTGHTHNFSIQEQHLIEWAGLESRALTKLGEIRVGSERLPLFEADVWIYQNIPGKTDLAVSRAPFCVELDAGVAVYPRSMETAPRLPLFGLRAMRLAGFRLGINCDALRLTIRSAARFRVF